MNSKMEGKEKDSKRESTKGSGRMRKGERIQREESWKKIRENRRKTDGRWRKEVEKNDSISDPFLKVRHLAPLSRGEVC